MQVQSTHLHEHSIIYRRNSACLTIKIHNNYTQWGCPVGVRDINKQEMTCSSIWSFVKTKHETVHVFLKVSCVITVHHGLLSSLVCIWICDWWLCLDRVLTITGWLQNKTCTVNQWKILTINAVKLNILTVQTPYHTCHDFCQCSSNSSLSY